jgi:hypothetical protein
MSKLFSFSYPYLPDKKWLMILPVCVWYNAKNRNIIFLSKFFTFSYVVYMIAYDDYRLANFLANFLIKTYNEVYNN